MPTYPLLYYYIQYDAHIQKSLAKHNIPFRKATALPSRGHVTAPTSLNYWFAPTFSTRTNQKKKHFSVMPAQNPDPTQFHPYNTARTETKTKTE